MPRDENTPNKRKETLIKKYGSEEAYLIAQRKNASKGGRTGKSGLHDLDPETRKKYSKIGLDKRWGKK